MKFACGIVLLVVIYTTTARLVSFKNVQTTEDFVEAGKHFLEVLQKKISEQDARLGKIERMLNIPGKSCKEILAANKFAVSGIYSIQPAVNKIFQVYCDMETEWGGWTLVYSYTFTNYNSFSSSNNAVTPRPNWPVWNADVPISTTPPVSESSLGALDWNLWKNIGKEFMVKSNINDWIICQPNGGRMDTEENGLISCQIEKNVATACSGVVPYRIVWWPRGPALFASSYYYFFEGSIHANVPIHDPCGTGNPSNHKKGVSNPGGQIYLR